jgi:integrase
MAILAECPGCHKRQAIRHRACTCGEDLVKAKGSNKVKYWIKYRLDGKQVWETVLNESGEKGTINDARASEGKRLAQRREKKITILDIKPCRITFTELTEWYLEQDFVKDRKNKERNLKDFKKEFGDRAVDSIQNSDLLNYQAKLKKEGKKDATVDNKMSSIKAVINQAIRDKKIPREVGETFSSVKKVLKKDSDGRSANEKGVIISFEQFNDLHEAIRERSKVPLKIAYYTGMREGEVLKLAKDRISLERRVIDLRPEDTKEKKAKEIPIIDEISPTLQELCEKAEDRIFMVTKDQFISDVKEACKKIGLPYGRKSKDGFTAHSLRHTFKTNAMRANVPQAIRMKISGHSTPEMDLRYSHPQLDDLRLAMEKIGQFVKSGEIRSGDEGSPILASILEEIKILKKWFKSGNKSPFDQEKGVNSISANSLN